MEKEGDMESQEVEWNIDENLVFFPFKRKVVFHLEKLLCENCFHS